MKTKTLVIGFMLMTVLAGAGVTGYRFMVKRQRISAAASAVNNAKMQEGQLHYDTAAEYWQKAAALLPEDSKKERALYLNEAGYDLHRIARYSEALPLFEQGLAIDRELGDRKSEGTTLNNISQIYKAQSDYAAALNYLEQSLAIQREIGDKAGESTTLGNIGSIHNAKGDYDKALPLYEQSLSITQEIGNKAEEAIISWNIGHTYANQGDLAKAELHMSRAVQLKEEIGHPKLEEYRTVLEDLRAKIKGL